MRFLLFCWFISIAFFDFALAQPQGADRTPRPSEEDQIDPGAASRYQLALGYMQGMQFDRAITILRELHVEDPQRRIFFEKLKEAYTSTKQYEPAIALIDAAILRNEQERPTLMGERAQLLYLSGDEPAAMQTWHALLDSASHSETAYRIAYSSLIQVRLLFQAIDLLLQGREVIGNHLLFQPELAYLYNLTGQYEYAMQEYLDLLSLNNRQLNYVRGRLGRDLEQEGALDVALRITQTRVDNSPDLWQLRELLAWLYEQNGDFQQAYTELITLENRDETSGQTLYQFALRAAEAGAFAVAGSAFQSVLETHPEEEISVEARLGIADMHRLQAEQTSRVEDYEQALEAYEKFWDDFPAHAQTPSVLTRIASLHQDVFRNREAARQTLLLLTLQYANSATADQARFDLGRLAVEEGNLDDAASIFAQLSSFTDGELYARSRFEEAMIHFYRGDFEAANSILNTIREETDKETANDAILLRVLLLETPPSDSTNQALQRYAHALLLKRQHKLDETAQVIQDILARWGRHPIADDARFLRAETLLLDGRSEDAMMAFGEFPLIHPESPLRDRSLFHYAELLEHAKHDSAAALQAYTDLLTQHPGSLLISKARERIRALRAADL